MCTSEAPVEAVVYDGLTVVLAGAVVQKLLPRSPFCSVLFRKAMFLHFVGLSQMNVLQALDLAREPKKFQLLQ